MKLIEISIENYRSIKKLENIKLASFQALVGENNCGKSNILKAIEAFLSAGSGGVKESDFNDPSKEIVIKTNFIVKSDKLKQIWKPYLINENLILEKHLSLESDEKTNRITVKSEFHGYRAEASDWFLSMNKITAQKGARPNWKEIIAENNLPEYFLDESGNCNKTQYKKGLDKYLFENNVNYEEPDLSTTQALGLQSNVISNFPQFYLLAAITDYSDEINKRSSNTTFRKLMADLSERILKNDPKYLEIEDALNKIKSLFNKQKENGGNDNRLKSLEIIESKIKSILIKLMPSVEKINLNILTDDIKTIFSNGVELTIDDGVDTDVLSKGHGLQRSIVFALLQTLILNERNELIDSENVNEIPILLAIEEPELYIHPQIGKLFYDSLNDFSSKHQVVYTTHSPRFIDAYSYENIALVAKSKETGTQLFNCDLTAFDGLLDRKIYQGLTQLNSDINELFFAKKVLLVEGPEDKVAITETCKKLNIIKTRTEEIEITVIVAGGCGNIPFFIRILNAFNIEYTVLHDTDIYEGMPDDDRTIITKRNETIETLVKNNKLVRFPIKLEKTLNHENHLKDQYYALNYFSNHSNINVDLTNIIKNCLSLLGYDIAAS